MGSVDVLGPRMIFRVVCEVDGRLVLYLTCSGVGSDCAAPSSSNSERSKIINIRERAQLDMAACAMHSMNNRKVQR
eukprot:2710253-Pleurochrysis_carterae.AAC.1